MRKKRPCSSHLWHLGTPCLVKKQYLHLLPREQGVPSYDVHNGTSRFPTLSITQSLKYSIAQSASAPLVSHITCELFRRRPRDKDLTRRKISRIFGPGSTLALAKREGCAAAYEAVRAAALRVMVRAPITKVGISAINVMAKPA